jgi:hypothetical protein
MVVFGRKLPTRTSIEWLNKDNIDKVSGLHRKKFIMHRFNFHIISFQLVADRQKGRSDDLTAISTLTENERNFNVR